MTSQAQRIEQSEMPRPTIESALAVLGSLRRKGVELWSEGGVLRYRAFKGALAREDLEGLRLHKQQILTLISADADAAECDAVRYAPLVYSQLSRWQLLNSGEIPSQRQIASATRVRGKLDVDVLRQALAHVVSRHDSLRTRIVVREGEPMQEISKFLTVPLVLEDLTEFAEYERELHVSARIRTLVSVPVKVDTLPLFEVLLLKLRDDEHVLVSGMEHMISDAFSIGILLRELLTAYAQAVQGQPFSLPSTSLQFGDYALRQAASEGQWLARHQHYWRELTGLQRLRFPDDPFATSDQAGWTTLPLLIDAELKGRLQQWCRREHTTLAMAVFTAYVALIFRWCNVREGGIRYQSDGRLSPEIENTIGFFAAALHLRLALHEEDTWIDLLGRVTHEYCRAHEHVDYCYLAAQSPRPEFTRNSIFNWVPQPTIDPTMPPDAPGAIACSALRIADLVVGSYRIDSEPLMLLHDTQTQVVGELYYPRNRFSEATMKRFGESFLAMVRALLSDPAGRISRAA